MEKSLIFKDIRASYGTMAWEELSPGARAKIHVQGGRRLRLLEFSGGFHEADWCISEHFGYVLDGTLPVRFKENGEAETVIVFQAGEGIAIPAGKPHHHEGTVPTGETITLFLVEKA